MGSHMRMTSYDKMKRGQKEENLCDKGNAEVAEASYFEVVQPMHCRHHFSSAVNKSIAFDLSMGFTG